MVKLNWIATSEQYENNGTCYIEIAKIAHLVIFLEHSYETPKRTVIIQP